MSATGLENRTLIQSRLDRYILMASNNISNTEDGKRRR